MTGPLLGGLGEQEVIRRVAARLHALPSPAGPGDDAAVVPAPDGRVVATTDLLVEGRHFRLDWSSPHDVGVKAAVQSLADVAAMGARPTALLVGLAAPADLPVAVAEGIADGLHAACAAAGTAVVGGDVVRDDHLVLAVTALGDLEGRAPLLRSGARPGDVVVLAGSVGPSAAGLWLLASGLADEQRFARLLAAHRAPEPPLVAGVRLARLGATAACDVSDGLVVDAASLAAASSAAATAEGGGDVVLALDLDAVLALVAGSPAGGEWRDAASLAGADARGWLLGGGEDHALLATVPPERVAAAREAGAVPVGEVRAAGGALRHPVTDLTGGPLVGGFDHFGAAPGSSTR